MADMLEVKWPNGKEHRKLVNAVKQSQQLIRTGKVLAVDPASGKTSNPGYCYIEGGKIEEYGDIDVDPRLPVQKRLAEICDCLLDEFPDVDVLVIEQIRGRTASHVLHWSIGAVVSHVRPPILLEIPLWTWKAVAKVLPEYKKSDDMDAAAMGSAVLLLAGIKGGVF